MKKASLPLPALLEGDSAARLQAINGILKASAKGAGHPAPTLIAVSKTQAAEAILPLLRAGHRHFGENRVQEALGKWPALRAEFPDVELHLVGQLQSNKAVEAVMTFDAIHSLDRSSLVRALASAIASSRRQPLLLVQVNIGAEPQKGGVALPKLDSLLAESRAAGLVISGLMAVPPADANPAPSFALLAKLASRHSLPLLSMGMSADYSLAAALGATHVRIGTSLFGAREPQG